MEIKIPLECFTLITGVSGSGKSSLIKQALKPALEQLFNGQSSAKRNYKEAYLNTQKYSRLEFIDQNPIGKSSRILIPAFAETFDDIRSLFSKQKSEPKL